MSFIQNFFTSRDNNANTESYVGQTDRLWYNPDTNSIRVSDGSTPGGLPIDLDTGANATFDIATANTVITGTMYANAATVYGELIVNGNISPAANGKIGGITPGPGVVISNQGELTIDTANLPLSFGNFYANNNILSIVNENENMVLAASGNAEIQLTGNVGFYRPDGFPPNVANRYFFANQDGQIEIRVPNVDPFSGALNVIGTNSGNSQSPVNPGVMIHVTGQNDIPSRIYNDAVGGYAGYIARRYNGNTTTPTPVLTGQEISRYGINGYKDGGWLTIGQARIDFISTDDQDNSNNGVKLEFWSTPKGNTTANITKVLELDASYGANIVGNLSVTGNVSGNVTSTNISANSITTTGNVVVGNTIRYDIASNNAVATQLTSKTTSVTANGRTGQITTNNASLSQNSAITFTVNNTFVGSTDVIIVNIQSGATASSYGVSVTRVNTGQFDIQIRNFTNGALADTIVLNFAIIKVS